MYVYMHIHMIDVYACMHVCIYVYINIHQCIYLFILILYTIYTIIIITVCPKSGAGTR